MAYHFKAPSQEIFDNMKEVAISIWKTYDDEYGYRTEKIERIESIANIQGNAMTFYRMFDYENQAIFREKSSDEVIKYIATHG